MCLGRDPLIFDLVPGPGALGGLVVDFDEEPECFSLQPEADALVPGCEYTSGPGGADEGGVCRIC